MPVIPSPGPFGSVITPATSGVAPSYVGIGDLAATLGLTGLNWWGFRAYSLAKIGTSCIDVRYNDGATATIVTVAGGALDVATLNAGVIAHPGPVVVSQIYDQVGSNNLVIGSYSLNTVLTIADSTLNNLPSIACISAANNGFETSAVITSHALPVTMALVAKHTAATSDQNIFWASNGASSSLAFYFSNTNQGTFYDGVNSIIITATDSTWSSHVGTIPTSGSEIYAVNGTQSTGISTGAIPYGGGIAAIGQFTYHKVDGSWAEMGAFAGVLTAGQITQMYNNIHNYYNAGF